MIILGAGMSGLLAGQYFRSHSPIIIERQASLPNNHHSLLRFRSDAVSKLTGITFKKVNVTKSIHNSTGSVIRDNNLYSVKATGSYVQRSIMNTDTAERYIAPEDFINRAAKGLSIVYNKDCKSKLALQVADSSTPMISTIPVNSLAKMLDYKVDLDLHTRPTVVINATVTRVGCDLYQTVYTPTNPKVYRVSITGNRLIVECIPGTELGDIGLGTILIDMFGIYNANISEVTINKMEHGKLVEGGQAVKDFIGWASTNFNIYSVGRWATHRQILMDDVVQDLEVVSRLIESNGYSK